MVPKNRGRFVVRFIDPILAHRIRRKHLGRLEYTFVGQRDCSYDNRASFLNVRFFLIEFLYRVWINRPSPRLSIFPRCPDS